MPQAIGPDKLLLQLNADGSNPIEDESGNRLDGDWTNPISTSDTGTSSFPSGDGTAGGNFLFRFNVVPGDVDANNGVNLGDYLLDRAKLGQIPGSGGYDIRYDVDGNGGINLGDALLARARLGYVLPSAEPTPGVFPASSGLLVASYLPDGSGETVGETPAMPLLTAAPVTAESATATSELPQSQAEAGVTSDR